MNKQNSKFIIVFLTIVLTFSGTCYSQEIPEKARKHLIRGKTAIEMAKQPDDFNLAIAEFDQAALLAPEWDEPYYQLGLVYEKLARYDEAIVNLKKFIELTKDAAKKTEVQDLIYKLEFKAEQALTPKAIVDILCTNFSGWEKSGDQLYWPYNYFAAFEKTGENSVKLFDRTLANDGGVFTSVDVSLTITGPVITFNTFSDQCSDDPCAYTIINELEFISRTEVIYRQTLFPIEPNSQSHKQEKLTATMKKK